MLDRLVEIIPSYNAMIELFIDVVLLLITGVLLDNHFRKFERLEVSQEETFLCAIFRPISTDVAHCASADFPCEPGLFGLVLSEVLKDAKSVNPDIVAP